MKNAILATFNFIAWMVKAVFYSVNFIYKGIAFLVSAVAFIVSLIVLIGVASFVFCAVIVCGIFAYEMYIQYSSIGIGVFVFVGSILVVAGMVGIFFGESNNTTEENKRQQDMINNYQVMREYRERYYK